MPTALRTSPKDHGDDEGPQAPEALLISALLEIGSFVPEAYGVSDTDIAAWVPLWKFCQEYQRTSGYAPPLSLVHARFPDFELTKSVNPQWAAHQLLDASTSRTMRRALQETLAALADGDVPGAYDALGKIQRPPALMRTPISGFDPSLVLDDATLDSTKIEVPFPTLGRATGGMALNEFWIVAARLGAGKSYVLALFVALALELGYSTAVLSLEMSARSWAHRVHQVLCRSNRELLADVRSDDDKVRLEAVEHLMSTTPGAFTLLDPSFGPVARVETVAELARRNDLVVIDHMGLLQTAKGDRAIEDWRIMAQLSNHVREISLSFPTRILAAAQINREGERHGTSRRPPKSSQLAQSDALGQDATAIVTMQRNSERVMAYDVPKVRDGAGARWFSRFQPRENRWTELTPDAAREMELADDISRDDATS